MGGGGDGGQGGYGGYGGRGQDGANGESVNLYKQSGTDPLVTAQGLAADITSITDVPGDQGGQVRVTWKASFLDAPPYMRIQWYELWREVPGSSALPGPQDAARMAQVQSWQPVLQIPAYGAAEYTCVATTGADSMFEFLPYSVFRVDAFDQFTGGVYESDPDSGYSKDNLPPVRPSLLGQSYGPGGMTLLWFPNGEPDLRSYRLYRGVTVDFTPSLSSLIAEVTATSYVDPVGTPSHHYKLTAMDIHGNESRPSCFTTDMPTPVLVSLASAEATAARVRIVWRSDALGSNTAVTVYRRMEASEWQRIAGLRADGAGEMVYEDRAIYGGEKYGYRLGITLDDEEFYAGEVWVEVPIATLSLRGVQPNPVTGPGAMIHFALPSDHAARLEVMDVSGRQVATQDVGNLGAGRHAVKLGNGASLAPGVYIVRLSQDGQVLKARAVIVR